MSDATLTAEGARAVVRFERHLADPPEVVRQALTDREQLNTCFPTDIVTHRWKVGAALTFPFRDGEGPSLTGRVLEYGGRWLLPGATRRCASSSCPNRPEAPD